MFIQSNNPNATNQNNHMQTLKCRFHLDSARHMKGSLFHQYCKVKQHEDLQLHASSFRKKSLCLLYTMFRAKVPMITEQFVQGTHDHWTISKIDLMRPFLKIKDFRKALRKQHGLIRCQASWTCCFLAGRTWDTSIAASGEHTSKHETANFVVPSTLMMYSGHVFECIVSNLHTLLGIHHQNSPNARKYRTMLYACGLDQSNHILVAKLCRESIDKFVLWELRCSFLKRYTLD